MFYAKINPKFDKLNIKSTLSTIFISGLAHVYKKFAQTITE
uniref:Uncharacterized protein n=1 Tax=Rheinheimera sp. BAL341 TaxID=1708203 RepID=A0A486XPJ9_9GAMM